VLQIPGLSTGRHDWKPLPQQAPEHYNHTRTSQYTNFCSNSRPRWAPAIFAMTLPKKKTVETATGSDFLLPRSRLTNKILHAKADTIWIGSPKGLGKSVLIHQLQKSLLERLPSNRVILLQLTHDNDLVDLLAALNQVRDHLNLRPAAIPTAATESLTDILDTLADKASSTKHPLHLLVDGLETRLNGSLIHYLTQSCHALSGRVRLYLGVDNFVPLLPNALFLDQRHLHLDMQDLRMNREELNDYFQLHLGDSSEKEVTRVLKKTDGIPSAIALLLDNYDESVAHQCMLLTEWIDQNLLCYLDPMEMARLAGLSLLSEFDVNQASQVIGVPPTETRHWLQHYIPLCFNPREDNGLFVWSKLMQPFFFNLMMERYKDLLPDIFKRVEPWLASSNTSDRCMDYIVACIEKPWACDMLRSRCKTWYGQRDAASVIQLAERIPSSARLRQREIAFYYCWALIIHKRISDARSWLKEVEHSVDTAPFDGNLSALKDNIAVLNALASFFDMPRPPCSVRVGLLESCMNRASLFQGEILSLYANMLHAVGTSDVSKNALKQAINFHEGNNNLPHVSHAKMLLWQCEYNQGNTDTALAEAQAYLSSLHTLNLHCSDSDELRALALSTAMIKAGLAELLYERNELSQAKALYEEAIPELVNSDWSYVSVIAHIGMIHLYISEGSLEKSLQEIERIKQRVPNRENTSLDAILCFESMRILRAQGKSVLPAASEYGMDIQHLSVESLFMDQYSKERLYWIKCYIMMLIEQKNYTSALIYSVKGLIKSLGANDHRCRVLFSNVKAFCEFKLNQHADAFSSMNISMQLVQKHQFIRALLNDDFGWSELWHHMDDRQEFGAELVPSFLSEMRSCMMTREQNLNITPPPQSRQDTMVRQENSRKLGLTDKEFEILTLLAEGLCNKKIASRSEIALTTVKWHLQNIFGKLQARNRTEAVVKAQEHAIIGKI